jgi:hypothetical protein
MRLLAFIVLVLGLTCAACSKDNGNNESILYGTWVKGSNFGDTLQFMRMNDRNILYYHRSFNADHPAYTETEYIFKNNQLTLISASSLGPVKFEISSFSWKQYGHVFQVTGAQLFPFMSSLTVFTYTKIH